MSVYGIVSMVIINFSYGMSSQNMLYSNVLTCPTNTESIIVTVSSSLECASACTRQSSCRSFSVETTKSGSCYLNTDSLVDTGCEDDVQHFNKLELPCLNGGIYTAADDSCRCFHGYIGVRCEKLMQDCSQGMTSGHYNGMKGIFTIHPFISPTPFPVWCKMVGDGRTYIMKKTSSELDFNRTWEEYKTGFGDLTFGKDFWLGNERLHYVTNHRPMVLVLETRTEELVISWNYRQRVYMNFNVSDERNSFNCSYSTTRPNTYADGIHILDDCLATQNMMAFTTVDIDNDLKDGENCAETHLSGWWYSDCGGCNPTGKLQPTSEVNQTTDPTYMSLPIPDNWAPRHVYMFLLYDNTR